MSTHKITAYGLCQKIANGEASAEGAVWDVLDRIDARDGEVRAYLTVDREGALRQAALIDRRARQGGRLGAL